MHIEHVAIYVHDLEAARRFFTELLGGISNEGYHNPTTHFRSYFISYEGGARIEIMTRPDMKPIPADPMNSGWAHVAFSVGSPQRVDALTEKLRGAGYEVYSGPRTTGDGYYESCIIALEGNLIELTV